MDASDHELADLKIRIFPRNFLVRGGCQLETTDRYFQFTINDMETGGSAGNPIVLDEEVDNENSPLITPMSERATEPSRLLRSRLFGTRIEKVAYFVYRNLFQKTTVYVLQYKNQLKNASLYVNFFSKTSQACVRQTIVVSIVNLWSTS